LTADPGKIRRLLPADLCHIDILVNNAGYLSNMPFESTTTEEIENMALVNFISPALLIRELLPLLGKSGISHVVNISSMGGFQGSTKFSGLSVYSATKAALACLTESLREEYKETDIIFNCLCLGAVQTEMLAEAFPGYKAETTSAVMGEFIAEFAINSHRFFKGCVLPVTKSNP
jgi:short-subunit dehydrogenase